MSKNKNRKNKNNAAERSAYLKGESNTVSAADIRNAVKALETVDSFEDSFSQIFSDDNSQFFRVEGLTIGFVGEDTETLAANFTEHDMLGFWILVKQFYKGANIKVIYVEQFASMVDWLTQTCSMKNDYRADSIRNAVRLLSKIDKISIVSDSVAMRIIGNVA